MVRHEEAVDFAVLTVRDFESELQHGVFLRALEFSDRETVLQVLRLGREEGFLEVRELGFQGVGNGGGVQAGYLRGEAVAGFGRHGGG